MTLPDPCSKVRAGAGAWACRTHGRPWPCRAGEQLGDQLTMLGEVRPEATAVLAEVAAEQVYASALHPPEADDEKDAIAWIDRLGGYLERLIAEADDVHAATIIEGGAVSLDRYRHRLVQTAGIAVAAAASIDRLTKG